MKIPLRTISGLWREAVESAPERLAVVDGGRRLTYRGADALVERFAAGISKAAARPRPKVAVFLPNCLEYYIIYWAIARLGGVIVPLNTWLKKKNLTSIFRNVRPDCLIVRNPKDEAAVAAAGKVPVIKSCENLLEESGPAPRVDIDLDDLAIIMHTSGTTAVAKGAMMRHSDLMFNVMTTINAHQFSPSDVHLIVNPMFHCTALYSSLTTAVYQKAVVVITASTSPGDLMQLVQEERITTFLSTPFILQSIANMADLREYDYSSLRLIAYAGAPMPVAAVRRLRERFPGVEMHNFFGLTETVSMTHVLMNEEADERPDSIGRLLPFVEAKVVGENDAELPPGQEGELLFARENVISGYYNQPEKMREALRMIDGREWFATGDLAVVDEEGFFFIKGRKKDVIIVGGENVSAAEVEAVLMEHDGVRDAAVKGIPATGVRSSLGEFVKAYIVPEDASLEERDIKKHCYERMASYKVPNLVVFLDELPRNPAGKVVKSELP